MNCDVCAIKHCCCLLLPVLPLQLLSYLSERCRHDDVGLTSTTRQATSNRKSADAIRLMVTGAALLLVFDDDIKRTWLDERTSFWDSI